MIEDEAPTAFGDESQRADRHSLTVVVVGRRPAEQVARGLMRCLLLAGERRIRFAHQSDRRRREVLSAIWQLPGAATTVGVRRRAGVVGADVRAALLEAAATAAAELGAVRLVLDRCTDADDRHDRQDRRALARARVKVAYGHADPGEEPLLWLPDAVGWCLGRGGEWPGLLPPGWRTFRRLDR